ncbi:MAG: FAD-dependent oxidoreductase [Bacteroidota bacterium]
MLNIQQLSYWERKTFFEEIDFLIVGAGIVGYSTAIHLRKRYPAAKILIVERGYLPSGASSKNAGFACFGSSTELLDDLKSISENKVWETVEKRWQGLNYLSELIGKENMNFQQLGSWDLISNNQIEKQTQCGEKLDYLNEKIRQITGEKFVYSEDNSINEKFGFAGLCTSFYNRLEGQIDTGKMIRKYYQLAIENNIDVLFGIEVKSFECQANEVLVNCEIGEIKTKKMLICTNGFASELIEEDVQPARAQVLVTKPIPNLKVKGTFHYDCGYFYFRNIDQRILLGGGRNLDFKGETNSQLTTTSTIMNALESLLHNIILPNQKVEIDYRWAGIMGVGATKEPIIKKIGEHIGIGVRMGGMGVAIGSLVGKELAEKF